jgi:cytochrome c peroxidase
MAGVGPAIAAPGDYREGYDALDWETRSQRVERDGTPDDTPLVPVAAPLGLPALQRAFPEGAAELGRALFFDRRLSGNATISCAMCHIPEQGFTSNELATPVGIEGASVRRNAPALYNVAYRTVLFHDGRLASLEQQVWDPLLAPNEMGNESRARVLQQVVRHYTPQFVAVFDTPPDEYTFGIALAAWQTSLVSANSRFDRWYFAGDEAALSALERDGFAVFQQSGCVACHTVDARHAHFTDDDFHDTGIGYLHTLAPAMPERIQIAPGVFVPLNTSAPLPPRADDGRMEVTGNPDDRWRYRTPTLRNVALTAPYMHDGSLPDLEAVIDYYAGGGSGAPGQDPRVTRLALTSADKLALVALLEALTGDNVAHLARVARAAPIGDEDGKPSSQERSATRMHGSELDPLP